MHDERGDRDGTRGRALQLLADERAVLVVGPAGAGRSTLLDAIASHDRVERAVWWCRGHQVGQPSGTDELWGRETGTLLRSVAAQPTTVVVDDAHLLADDIVDRLVALAERRHELDLRLAVGRRDVRPTPSLARLDEALLGRRGALQLGPLPLAEVERWMADAGRTAAGDADRDAGDGQASDGPRRTAAELVARTGGWAELVAAELAAPGAGAADLTAARLAQLDADHRRILRALAFGLPVGSTALLQATDSDPATVDAAVDASRAVGVLHEGTTPVPVVVAALRGGTPAADRARIAAAAVTCGPPDLLIAVARELRQLDDRSAEAGRACELAADALAATAPAVALDLYAAAIAAGRPDTALAARRAAAALAAGRPDEAVTLAVQAPPSDGAGAEARRRVAGAAWSQLASPDLAADCYTHLDGDRHLAVVPLVAAGRIDDARQLLAEPADGPPTAARHLAAGVAAWMTGDLEQMFPALERSALLAQVEGGVAEWPDSPHAVLAFAAAPWLDAERAERVAGAALEHAVGGGAFTVRHRLAAAWAGLRAGRIDAAREVLDDLPAPLPGVRDAVTAAALAAAVALRVGEPADLPRVHRAATEALSRGDPDPLAPDLVGELAHLAARVGADPRAHLAPVERLAAALGDPPTLAVPLAWARLMVAVATDDAAGARDAAAALATRAADPALAAGAPRDATRLYTDAARAFADALDGVVAPDAVKDTAGRLAERGLLFEATRLIGTAALRSSDATAARALLTELRRLQGARVRGTPGRARVVAELSPREREVARAVLDGHTHREIGTRLYISAKTVEHHVARIRQKLGATTRAELLAAIREQFDDAT